MVLTLLRALTEALVVDEGAIATLGVLQQELPTQNVYSKGTLVYSTVSSLQDCSGHFALHPLADLIPMPTRLLWEVFSRAAITAGRLFVHVYL